MKQGQQPKWESTMKAAQNSYHESTQKVLNPWRSPHKFKIWSRLLIRNFEQLRKATDY
jgi:hypothetical protein